MTSKAEQTISQLIRTVLAELPTGSSIPECETFRNVLSHLEFYMPALLREIHSEWDEESLDGVIPILARKTGEGEVELFGLCIIISDRTLTPIHVRFQVAASNDEISWLECTLGERGQDGMVRMPYQSRHAKTKSLYALDGRADLIEWLYKVTFGHRRL
jgi:hypothetical protein